MTNKLGHDLKDYEGAKSTLCVGCGHNLINAALAQACYDADITPSRTVKISGIGCSSKSPAYILGQAHGFNGLHGRMPSVAIGAHLAAHDLRIIGISGDGDSAAIGMGQFIHAMRYNPRMLYLVYNNGCYGLTKGQNSATADRGSKGRKAPEEIFPAVDLAQMAIIAGAGFVARGFAGDKLQLQELFKAAFEYQGLALIDIISPCITFNNTENSTKSYRYALKHGRNKASHDPHDRSAALSALNNAKENDEILTGLIYINRETEHLSSLLDMAETPLRELGEGELCPGNSVLQVINDKFR